MYKKQLLFTLFTFACISTLKGSTPHWAPGKANLSLTHNIPNKGKAEPQYQRESPSWVEDVKNHPILFSAAPVLTLLVGIIGSKIGIMDGNDKAKILYEMLGAFLVAAILPALLLASWPSLWQVKEGENTQGRTHISFFCTRFWRSFRFLASSAWTFVPYLTLVTKGYNIPFLSNEADPTSLDKFLVFILYQSLSRHGGCTGSLWPSHI